MKVIWLSIHFPSYSRSGGDVASASMLKSVVATGWPVYSVHVYHAPPPAEEVESFRTRLGLAGVRFVTTARRGLAEAWLLRLFLVALLPFLPVSYSRLMWPNVRRRYRAVLADIARTSPREPILVIADGLQPCALLRAEGLDPDIAYVYRAHNVERDLWRSAARLRSPLARVFLFYQAWRLGRLERWVLDRFDQVQAISRENQTVLRSAGREPVKVRVTPVAFDLPFAPEEIHQARVEARSGEPDSGLRLLFLGKLDWPPNRDGIAWFLDRVWTGLLSARPDASLTIVGLGEALLKARYGHLPRVRFTGHASDAELRYMLLAHDLLIVPVLSGSGVRIKVVEAAMHGLASIGTSIGMSGASLEPDVEFLAAEGASAWIEALAKVDRARCDVLGERAFAKARGLYARESVDRAVVEALRDLLPQEP